VKEVKLLPSPSSGFETSMCSFSQPVFKVCMIIASDESLPKNVENKIECK